MYELSKQRTISGLHVNCWQIHRWWHSGRDDTLRRLTNAWWVYVLVLVKLVLGTRWGS